MSDYQRRASLYALYLIGGLCLLAVLAEMGALALCIFYGAGLPAWAQAKCGSTDWKAVFIELVGVFGAAWGVQRISNGKA